MTEETQQITLDDLYVTWLKEHNAQPVMTAIAPKGGEVSVENFVPDGWRPSIRHVEAKPQ